MSVKEKEKNHRFFFLLGVVFDLMIYIIQVMSHGYVVEFDTPYNLLQRRNGVLSRMVDRTGEDASAVLRAMVRPPT